MAEKGIPRRDLQWNFLWNTLDGALFGFGMSFVSLVTVLPVFVTRLGGGHLAVGLIPVLWSLGFNFPQLAIVPLARRLPRKKSLVLKTALYQRLPWLGMAALGFPLAAGWTPAGVLALFFLLFLLAALGSGFNLPVWFDLVFKVTPLEKRGRLFALRTTLGALLGILAGWLVTRILDGVRFPVNFSLLFLLGFLMMSVSYLFLVLIREADEYPFRSGVHGDFHWRAIPAILKQDRNFRNFLAADVLLVLALIGNTFLAVHALERFALPPAYVGVFTMVMMGSLICGAFIFGVIGDTSGHRFNLVLAALLTGGAFLLAAWAPSLKIYLVVFVLSALTVGILQVSRLTIVAELCPEGERAAYVALVHLVSMPFSLAGLLAGWIAAGWGYGPLFLGTGGLALLAAAVLIFAVVEPRHLPGRTIPSRVFHH